MKYLIIDKRSRVKVKGVKDTPTAVKRIQEELDKRNTPSDFAYYDQIEYYLIDSETHIRINKQDIQEYSHIIFRSHTLHNPKEYELKRLIIDFADQYNKTHINSPIKVQNSKAIKNYPYYNKIFTAQLCATHNIPYLDTYYRPDGEYDKPRDIFNEYPYIIKEYAGVNRVQKKNGKLVIKKNVYKIDSVRDLRQKYLRKQNLESFFIQEFVPDPIDSRIFVKNGNVIGGWKREATKGFMTVSKGKYTMYNSPEPRVVDIAEKFANILEADFIAVDFMYKDNQPYIQEFSFHPGFKAYETKITDDEPVNIAEAIIDSF